MGQKCRGSASCGPSAFPAWQERAGNRDGRNLRAVVRGYWTILLTTLDMALCAPPLVYATAAKYQVPFARFLIV
jgi:hypothetical protein